MTSDGSYVRVAGDGVDSQQVLMDEAGETDIPEQVEGFVRSMIQRFVGTNINVQRNTTH